MGKKYFNSLLLILISLIDSVLCVVAVEKKFLGILFEFFGILFEIFRNLIRIQLGKLFKNTHHKLEQFLKII